MWLLYVFTYQSREVQTNKHIIQNSHQMILHNLETNKQIILNSHQMILHNLETNKQIILNSHQMILFLSYSILLQVREYVACSFTYLPRLRSASKTYRTLIKCYWKAWSTMKYIEQAFNSKILDMHRPKVWLLCTHTNIVILA